MMKVLKKFLSAFISLAMVVSLITVSAAEGSVQIIKDGKPETMDWTAQEVAYIDFSDITEISLTNGVEGKGIKILPNNGATGWMAANRVKDGYMLLGKEANTDGKDPATYKEGHIYFNLDQTFFPKREAHYIVKVDYFGGGSGTINDGSFITLYYKSLTKDGSSIKKTFDSTYNSGKIESFYYDLADANLGQSISDKIKGDIRLTTWGAGAQLKIKRISVLEYDGIDFPEAKEVRKGNEEPIASIDFSKISEVPLSGTVVGDGLTLVTSISTGNTRASNKLEDGYLLLGKKARKNDNSADMVAKPEVNGAVYIKLNASLEEKANTPYAVKIDYYGGGNYIINSGSFIEFHYNSVSLANANQKKTYNATYNSGKDESMYFLLSDADFCEKTYNNISGADFRLQTWCGNNDNEGAQLKIKKISVVEYDGAKNDNPAVLFSDYSEGKIKGNKALYNMNTGEFTGLSYLNAEQVKINDTNSDESFAIIPLYDTNGLGTIGFRISDKIVKAANETVLTVYYWDVGTDSFRFEYNASDTAYKATADVKLTDTGVLKCQAITLKDTVFTQNQTYGYDFKLLTYIADLCIAKLELQAVVKGDLDESGILDSSDLVIMRKALLSNGVSDSIYNINADDAVDIRDLITLKKLFSALQNT